MKESRTIEAAKILGPHGVRGEVKIRPYIDADILFSHVLTDKTDRQFKLARRGGTEDALIASVEGVADRDASEKLKGLALFIDAGALPKRENVWRKEELIGLEARLKSGAVYGRVTGTYNFGAGDIIEIELANGKNEMLPFEEPFVGNVDTHGGYIIVSPPDYMEAKEK